jgi:putative DNA primase/helicase
VDTLLAVFGEYAGSAVEHLLLAKGGDSHPTELADLFGKRLVVASEISDGRTWNAARVKLLTGGDRVKARRMREDFWEFDPTHKFIVLSNPRPRADASDMALWERLKLVAFDQCFKAKPDKKLKEKLRGHLPAVLAWAVQGCLAWQKDGLVVSTSVTAATEEYREELRELDPMEVFMADYNVPPSGTTLKQLCHAYNLFAKEKSRTSRELKTALQDRGYTVDRGTGNVMMVWAPGATPIKQKRKAKYATVTNIKEAP